MLNVISDLDHDGLLIAGSLTAPLHGQPTVNSSIYGCIVSIVIILGSWKQVFIDIIIYNKITTTFDDDDGRLYDLRLKSGT